LLDRGIHTSWWTIRQILKTHQICTIVLPTDRGKVLNIRKASKSEPDQFFSSVVNRRPDKDTLHFAACAISQTIGLIPHCLSVLKLFCAYIKTAAEAVKGLPQNKLYY
jgi:hypothetical protein